MRRTLKAFVGLLCSTLVLHRVAAFRIASVFIGRERAIEGATQGLARVPGIRGQYLRRAFLRLAGVACHPTATLCYGTTVSKLDARFDENVYVGPGCHLGLVHLERDVLLAAGVHVPSGAHMHGTADPTVSIREQKGVATRVRIGAGTWVGSGAVILADVGRNCVVGAGSVVTSAVPDDVIAAGVPARVIRSRREATTRTSA